MALYFPKCSYFEAFELVLPILFGFPTDSANLFPKKLIKMEMKLDLICRSSTDDRTTM